MIHNDTYFSMKSIKKVLEQLENTDTDEKWYLNNCFWDTDF